MNLLDFLKEMQDSAACSCTADKEEAFHPRFEKAQAFEHLQCVFKLQQGDVITILTNDLQKREVIFCKIVFEENRVIFADCVKGDIIVGAAPICSVSTPVTTALAKEVVSVVRVVTL